MAKSTYSDLNSPYHHFELVHKTKKVQRHNTGFYDLKTI